MMNTVCDFQSDCKSSQHKKNTLFHLSFAIFTWSIIVFVSIFYSILALISFFPVYVLDKQRKFLHNIAIHWALMVLKILPKVHYKVVGEENLPDPKQTVIYVANHLSQADILAIFAIKRQFRWIAKASLFQIPFVGWAMTAIGYVPVNRNVASSKKQALELSRLVLRNGLSMMFFPEGTRSEDGTIKRFKLGAFKLACEENIPIIPITLVGTETLLPKGEWIPQPTDIQVIIHPAVKPENFNQETLAEYVQKIIADTYEQARKQA